MLQPLSSMLSWTAGACGMHNDHAEDADTSLKVVAEKGLQLGFALLCMKNDNKNFTCMAVLPHGIQHPPSCAPVPASSGPHGFIASCHAGSCHCTPSWHIMLQSLQSCNQFTLSSCLDAVGQHRDQALGLSALSGLRAVYPQELGTVRPAMARCKHPKINAALRKKHDDGRLDQASTKPWLLPPCPTAPSIWKKQAREHHTGSCSSSC